MGKTGWLRERGEQKWDLDISLIIKKRTDAETQQTAKQERSVKEYWNEGAHAYRLLVELAPDSTKLFMRKLYCFNLNPTKWNQLSL